MRISIALMTGIIALTGISLGCLLNASSPWANIATIAFYAALGIAPLGIIHKRRWAFYLGFTLWAWAYVFLTSNLLTPIFKLQLPTSQILDTAYPILIAQNRREESKLLELKIGLSTNQFNAIAQRKDAKFLDISMKGASKPVEAVRINKNGLSILVGSGPDQGEVLLDVTEEQHAQITNALKQRKDFVFTPHQLGFFEQLAAKRPVDPESFKQIGHSLFGLLLGLTGGLIGIRFYRSRET